LLTHDPLLGLTGDGVHIDRLALTMRGRAVLKAMLPGL
jgi:hypothetical protein